MNRKIGMVGATVNVLAVAGFALCMLLGSHFGSYLSSMLIAFSFVLMISAFCHFGRKDAKVAGNCSIVFAAVYTVLILVVYFAQLTTVRTGGLSEQAAKLLDYTRFDLFFSYDLLGYGLMALATFFAGLTISAQSKGERWLKALLLIHGIFFVSCLIMPMLGVFHGEMEGADWIGTAILEFWCAYFLPIGVLSIFYFKRQPSKANDENAMSKGA